MDASTADARRLLDAGNAREDRGDLEGALMRYREAIATAPGYPRAYLNLGNILQALRRFDEAITAYRTALTLDPKFAPAHFNLGNLHAGRDQLDRAEGEFRAALRLAPDMTDAAIALANVLQAAGHTVEAERTLRTALSDHPGHAGCAHNLGVALRAQHRWADAETAFEQALAADPDFALSLAALAELRTQAGRLKEAESLYRHAIAARPDSLEPHSGLLFSLNLRDDLDAETIFNEHRRFGQRLEQETAPCAAERRPLPADHRIRVGYVSGDLKEHPVALFLRPVLKHHDRSRFEVFCYSNCATADSLTRELKSSVDHWRNIADLDDSSVARMIGADAIDVLVDLSGHTGLSRLMLFAHRPAPLQVTWLGYLNTTGLRTIDFRICDRHTDPPGATDHLYTERLFRMPNSQWCYMPVYDIPLRAPPHPDDPGRLVLGSFNQYSKLSDECLDSWCELMRRLPSAELKVLDVRTERSAADLLERMGRRGIDRHRIALLPRLAILDYFAAIGDVDIALDTIPYNGATTTLDILWMGVPLVAPAGPKSITRGSASILRTLGMPELISHDKRDYIDLSLRLAADTEKRSELRRSLRPRMEASPLMDAARFTRDLENGYRTMWATS